MTSLTKAVRRHVELALDYRPNARDRDTVVVTLYPDKTIGFRQYRCRREVRLHLLTVYKLACIEAGRQGRAERKRSRLVQQGLL